jgi:hypothetical protein
MIFPPFVYVTWQQLIARARAYKRGSRFVPEVAKCLGPQAEGITGDGSMLALYSRAWALILERSGQLVLAKQSGSRWIRVQPLQALPVLPRAARHIALSFDQAARPILAWQENQSIFVRQWDGLFGQYVIRGPFAGLDPVLFMDAQLLQTTSDSDVHLFFLSLDKKTVHRRLQRDQFSIEYSFFVLANESILDTLIVDTYNYRLILQDALTQFLLVSEQYPAKAFVLEALNLSGGLSAGDEFLAVVNNSLLETLSLSGGLSAGDEFLTVMNNPLLEALSLSGGLSAGDEFLAILNNPLLEALNLSGGLSAGDEFLAILNNSILEALNLSGGLIGGSEL